MFFSRIYFPEEIEDIENKLRINLSNFAFSVLNYDADAFGIGKTSDSRISSAAINRIFDCYKNVALSSVALSLETRREELLTMLRDVPGHTQVIEHMLKIYREELCRGVDDRLKEKGKAFSIRVDDKNLEYLRSNEGYAERLYYDDRVGLYVKAVIEEYCQQPYVIREQIYFVNNWNAAIRAIEDSRVLKLKLRSRSDDRSDRHNTMYIIPFSIEQDLEHMYNYLVGMCGPTQGGPWQIGSVRLASVITAECQKKSTVLSSEDKRHIRNEIKVRGVQFLSDRRGVERVVVLFTQDGEKMYQKMLHLRPQYVAKEGLVYTFDCTIQQANNYFFKYGHHAKVLKPQYLADMFKRKYQSAAKQYE